MVSLGRRSPVVALEPNLAAVVDAERLRLRTVGEYRPQIWQLHIGPILGDEPLDIVQPAPAARLEGSERRAGSESRRGMAVIGLQPIVASRWASGTCE